jgi:hypothetical protein
MSSNDDDVNSWLVPGVLVWVLAWGPGFVYEVERVPVSKNALVPLKSRQGLAQAPRRSLCRAVRTENNDACNDSDESGEDKLHVDGDERSAKRTKNSQDGVNCFAFNRETIAAVRSFGMDEEALLASLHKIGIFVPEIKHAHAEWCCEALDASMLLGVVDACAALMLEGNVGGWDHRMCTCRDEICCGIAQFKNLAYRMLGLLTLRVGSAPNDDLIKRMAQGDLKYRQSTVTLPFPAYAYPVYQAVDEAKGMLSLDSGLCREEELSEYFSGNRWALYGAGAPEPD